MPPTGDWSHILGHVLGPGIEPATFWFMGQFSTTEQYRPGAISYFILFFNGFRIWVEKSNTIYWIPSIIPTLRFVLRLEIPFFCSSSFLHSSHFPRPSSITFYMKLSSPQGSFMNKFYSTYWTVSFLLELSLIVLYTYRILKGMTSFPNSILTSLRASKGSNLDSVLTPH